MSEAKYRFYYPIQVRYADTDAQGHVFFGNYLTYFDEGMGAYLRAVGFPWPKLQEMGLDVYYVEAACRYKGSATFEEMLHVHTKITRIGNTSFTITCAIYKPDGADPITTGHITAVVVDPQTRQPVRVPDGMRQAIADYEAGA